MQTLGLDENCDKDFPGFWQRQYQVEQTEKQKVFDWVFGVIFPVICVAADPIVFRGHGALFEKYQLFAYSLSFVSIMMMTGFLLFGKKLGWLNGALSGLFGFGAAVCFIVGVFIFPFSVIGLVVLIGALGFTPLFSAFVYARSAVRAYRFAEYGLNDIVLMHLTFLGALLSFTLPWVLNGYSKSGVLALIKTTLMKIVFW